QISHMPAAASQIERAGGFGRRHHSVQRQKILALGVNRAFDIGVGARAELTAHQGIMGFAQAISSPEQRDNAISLAWLKAWRRPRFARRHSARAGKTVYPAESRPHPRSG